MDAARKVVISGAGSGIGRALAIGFAGDGCEVFGCGRNEAALTQTAALCPDGRFHGHRLDVTDAREVDSWIEQIESTNGPIDALVCNAAVYPRTFFLDQPAGDWDEVLRINVGGVANLCRAVLPRLLRRYRGRIVVMGSLANTNPIPAASAYSVSKGALHALTKALAAEVDRKAFPSVMINEYVPKATLSGMNSFGADPAFHYRFVRDLALGENLARSGGVFTSDGEVFIDHSIKSMMKNIRQKIRRRIA